MALKPVPVIWDGVQAAAAKLRKVKSCISNAKIIGYLTPDFGNEEKGSRVRVLKTFATAVILRKSKAILHSAHPVEYAKGLMLRMQHAMGLSEESNFFLLAYLPVIR